MSSRRFPGKVLAPFRGRPLICHVVDAVVRALPNARAVVLTSHEPSDDPIAAYLGSEGVAVFRGPLDDVFERFRLCLQENPCELLVRVCADSPLLDENMLRAVVRRGEQGDVDVVSTTYPRRTFPQGQNAELVRADAFLAVDRAQLAADEREHVTPYFYRRPHQFRLATLVSGHDSFASSSLAVDTIEDLARLERLSGADLAAFTYPSLATP